MPRLRVLFDDGTERVLAFDEAVHAVDLGANPEYDTTPCASSTSRW